MHVVTLKNGTKKNVRIGGWKKQKADPRDEHFRLKAHRTLLPGAAKSSCDNRGVCSPVEDLCGVDRVQRDPCWIRTC
jgi:hypothetical protein